MEERVWVCDVECVCVGRWVMLWVCACVWVWAAQ